MNFPGKHRRTFLHNILAAGGLAAASPIVSEGQARLGESPEHSAVVLPNYARAQNHKSLKQSSYDRTGGNHDYWDIPVGGTLEVFKADGPGVISHIWFTMNARGTPLKELVLRGYWDGNSKPSVETPLGDFFGLNLGIYQIYQSEFLACSPGMSLNSYFAMPYRESARFTVTNEGAREVSSFYSNIDYMTVPRFPDDAMYFHAQYRQSQPCIATTGEAAKINLDGHNNYVFVETHGQGHLMGVTLGVLTNAEGWWGEGDDMIFIDDESKPAINGTGSEDYFLGSWDFNGQIFGQAFDHRLYGAPLIVNHGHTDARYCCYRWHADNPITFKKYLKHTIEHGHANNRADNFYSVAYWYQSAPYTDFPPLPPVKERVPALKIAQS